MFGEVKPASLPVLQQLEKDDTIESVTVVRKGARDYSKFQKLR